MRLLKCTLVPLLLAFAQSPALRASEPLFEFGPRSDYVTSYQRFNDSYGAPMVWGMKRLFSDTVPLTPSGAIPAVYGGYEFFNFEGKDSAFIDYNEAHMPTTGVMNDSFGDDQLDALAVKAGHVAPETPRSISYAVGFLVLGKLSRPVLPGPEFSVAVRLSNEQVGVIPGSVRVVVRIGDKFFASDHEVQVNTEKDRRIVIRGRDLAGAKWSLYHPEVAIGYEGEVSTSLPTGIPIDMAGVLITRVVNESHTQNSYFATISVAELQVAGRAR